MSSEAVKGLSRLRDAAIFLTVAMFLALFGRGWLLRLVAWIFRVWGWWSMRKSGWRKGFYTVVWLTVTIGPVAAFLLSDLILVAALITAIVSTIEGVASLDVGLLTKVKLLSAGSVVYMATAFLGMLSGPVLLRGYALPLTLAASVASLVASVLLAIGFHQARGAVAREAQ